MPYIIEPSNSIVRRLAWAMLVAGIAFLHAVADGAEFSCKAGDVSCLTNAILQANANGQTNTIYLKAGRYTLSTPAIPTVGRFIGTGFPVITSMLTIQGASATKTVVERDSSDELDKQFRLFMVEATGNLTLADLTLQGGGRVAEGFGATGGGAVLNHGTLAIIDSVIRRNELVGSLCGGILSHGRLTVARSTITENSAYEWPGGICVWGGTAMILESSIVANTGINGAGLDVAGGLAFVQNSTIARNVATSGGGVGGVSVSGGSAILINSTIAENIGGGSGGIATFHAGQVALSNTILARNRTHGDTGFVDCRATQPNLVGITSLGHNLIGNVTGCNITLVGGDLTGDPGLALFKDNGKPGNGHFPLLPKSPAKDAGLDAVCPRVDQLGQRRSDDCDIGAIRR
jgi:hypothetical protein